ncbi:hypothetical protein OJAV_G00071980 [Oryzias javanicus]|uniref:Uncharacterized protein n=1 Tax=Oryzias javanicus TaxID=123683 RepID=A0A437D8Y2_ORYJA|nr:hypothetical protein OJAV_G00071980 [Oryzias javanicus]
MSVCQEWQIFIPEEAEVQSLPLQSLPPSVLKRMGLPPLDCDPSRRPADLVTWICPAFVGKKGRSSAPPTGRGRAEGVRTLMRCGSGSAPLKMSFVSSNRVALEVLKDISHRPHSRPLPQGSAPTTNQTALVIHRGLIYLCIRKSGLSQKQQKRSSTPLSLSADSRVTEAVTEKAPPAGVRPPPRKSGAAPRREAASPDSCSAKRVRMERAGLEGGREGGGGGSSPAYEEQRDSEAAAPCERTDAWKEGAPAAAPAGAPAGAPRLQFDFGELEEEERIAQMRARFLEDEAALNTLLSGP